MAEPCALLRCVGPLDAPHSGRSRPTPALSQTRRSVGEVSLEDTTVASEQGAGLVALDEALKTLAAMDPRKARIVELRFFGGLTVEETAEVLKISPRTVKREWSLAQAWLYCELTGEEKDDA
jgi:RNA polymerase sigma factor (TIGR02999 family)